MSKYQNRNLNSWNREFELVLFFEKKKQFANLKIIFQIRYFCLWQSKVNQVLMFLRIYAVFVGQI